MAMITNDWLDAVKPEFSKEYYKDLFCFVKDEYSKCVVYPPADDIFNACHFTPLSKVKVLILGQDPYHGVGEANGLAFSVNDGINLPPSLQNIYKELNSDLNIPISTKGDLTCWAKEGVLLLNTVLTVEKDRPASHKNLGWENFTDAIIKKINEKDTPVVFILWGNFAKSKKNLITNPKHLIIESSHPSPFSCNYGFFGSRPFSRTNKFLRENNIKEIDFTVK